MTTTTTKTIASSKTASARLKEIEGTLRDMRRQESPVYSIVMAPRRKPLPTKLSQLLQYDILRMILLEVLYKIFSCIRMIGVLWIDIPTPYCYMHVYLDLVLALHELNSGDDNDGSDGEDLEDVRSDLQMAAHYFLRDVTLDSWCDAPPSVVAYAAMLVALEDYAADDDDFEPTPPPSKQPVDRRAYMASTLRNSIRKLIGNEEKEQYNIDRRSYLKLSLQKSLRNLKEHEEENFNLQRSFVKAMRRTTGIDSQTTGLYDLILLMSDSATAASLCMSHAQSYK